MTSPTEPGDLFYPQLALTQPNTLPVPIVWSAITPTEQEHFLEALDLWVDWLTDRYRLDHRTVPQCWHEHPELLEELSALHLAWQGAYATAAAPDAALHWHEHFAAAVSRLNDWVARTGCRPSAHRPRASLVETPAR